ncbi:MAG: CotH kinase family protein [Acidobacteria bacterium]|nr:CotH kinase family protein [Acidobacteriota bacterium]
MNWKTHWWAPVLLLALPALASSQESVAYTVADFFDGSQLQTLRIEMVPSDWQRLKDNYLEDTYYRCRMEWKDLVVEDASIKSRGSGSRNPLKPGLGIDFSKVVSSHRFLGLKSLVLRNSVQDDSMVHERLAMAVFERMGLVSLRTASAELYVNGEYAGLYQMVEPIDSRLLLEKFGETSGYLFEFNNLADGYGWQYLGDDPALYVPDRWEPKNHDSDPDAAWIVSMLQAVNLSSDEDFLTAAGKYVDLDNFVIHAAVENFMAEWDGVLGDTGSNNFYFYRRAGDDRGTLIAWDKEGTFTSPDWWIWRTTDQNALMRRLLLIPQYRQLYLETLASTSETCGGEGGWLWQEARRVIDQVRPSVLLDPFPICNDSGADSDCRTARRERAWSAVLDFAAWRKPAVDAMLREEGFSWTDYALGNRRAPRGRNSLRP